MEYSLHNVYIISQNISLIGHYDDCVATNHIYFQKICHHNFKKLSKYYRFLIKHLIILRYKFKFNKINHLYYKNYCRFLAYKRQNILSLL